MNVNMQNRGLTIFLFANDLIVLIARQNLLNLVIKFSMYVYCLQVVTVNVHWCRIVDVAVFWVK